MGIHQALFAGYGDEITDWTIVSTDPGNSWRFRTVDNDFQAGDLVLFIGQSDNDSINFNNYYESTFPTTELVNADDNSIDYAINFGKMPSGVNYIQGVQGADIGMAIVIRPSITAASYSLTVKSTEEHDDFPNHNNVSNSLTAGSLAILIGMLDDDEIDNISPPSDSTSIAMDKDSRGTMGVAYKKIATSGNYSWGSWSTTSSETDRSLAFVVEIIANET